MILKCKLQNYPAYLKKDIFGDKATNADHPNKFTSAEISSSFAFSPVRGHLGRSIVLKTLLSVWARVLRREPFWMEPNYWRVVKEEYMEGIVVGINFAQ